MGVAAMCSIRMDEIKRDDAKGTEVSENALMV